ncbi:MAG: hypothetical protein AAGA06_05615 [Pseudomonadota bacterium]
MASARGPRTAYIHIGAPKTGSTAIQAVFSQVGDALHAQGFHYLSGDRNHSERLSLAFWDEEDAARLARFRWVEDPATFARLRVETHEGLADEIARAHPHDVIASAEELSEFTRDDVKRLMVFFALHVDRIRVIAYAREPVAWMNSAAQQSTKWSGDCLDDILLHPRLPRYQARFQGFIDATAPGDFILRPFGGSDVVADFSGVLGLPAPLTSRNVAQPLNASVSHETAIMFSKINEVMPPFVDCRHNPCRAFSIIKDGRLPGRKFTLPRETIEEHATAIAAERDWLNARLGHGVFSAPNLPTIGRREWFGPDRTALEDYALTFLDKCRSAQNEAALKFMLKALKQRDHAPEVAAALLDKAWLLSTDRWSMDMIAREGLAQDRPDIEKYFLKQRIMRRVEAPLPDDAPLLIGNPFDRPWRTLPSNELGEQCSPSGPATKSPELTV